MLKKRLIPVVLLRNGVAVQSKGFRRFQQLGDPVTIVQRLSDWASDELIYLDITRDRNYDLGRDDLNNVNLQDVLDILAEISRHCFMPLTFGGGIRSLQDIEKRIERGADKVVINSQALARPDFINEAARHFGAQCIVTCIDAKTSATGGWEVFSCGGRQPTGRAPSSWAAEARERGTREILVQSIDRDGTRKGFDIPLIRSVTESVAIPVVALGGAGDWQHFEAPITKGRAAAVAAANIFNHTENSVYRAKKHLFDAKVNVREPMMGYSL